MLVTKKKILEHISYYFSISNNLHKKCAIIFFIIKKKHNFPLKN